MAEDSRQTGPAHPEQPERDPHVPGRLRDLLGRRLDAEVYLSTEEGAQLVGRPSREAFIKWCRRHGVPLRRPPGGRTLVARKGDIDFALRVR